MNNLQKNESVKKKVELKTEVKEGYLYRHHKGKLYYVMHRALNKEEDLYYVVYRAMYGEHQIYTQEESDFLATIYTQVSGKWVSKERFEIMEG